MMSLNQKQQEAFATLVHNLGILHELTNQLLYAARALADCPTAEPPRKIEPGLSSLNQQRGTENADRNA